MAQDDHAIVVGIARYPRLTNLKGPEIDAMSFREWLISSCGGDVPEAQAKLILSSHYAEPSPPEKTRPMTSDIESEFDRLINLGRNNNGKAGRRLYIFLAGHGFAPAIDESALLMGNAGLGASYHIPGRSYAKWFHVSAFFEEIVLLMDCCRDENARAPVHHPPWNTISGGVRANNVRTFYGFATEWARRTRERRITPGDEVRGLFTHAILEGLNRGYITGSSLKNFVYNYMPKLLEGEECQEPKFDCDERREIIFVERSPLLSSTVRFIFTQFSDTMQLDIIGPDHIPVWRGTITQNPWEIELKPGIYKLQTSEPIQEQQFQVIREEEEVYVRL